MDRAAPHGPPDAAAALTPGTRFSRAVLAVLAGGRSSRFGSSKLLVHWKGEPILAWQARQLRGWGNAVAGLTLKAGGEAWLNLPAERVAHASPLPPGCEQYDRIIRDAQADLGPLAGIASILDAGGEGDVIAIVPADMPLITPGHLARLARALIGANVVAAMSRWAGGAGAGRVEPLPSVWHVGGARALVREQLARGAGPSGLADHPLVKTIALDESDRAAWGSINTPEDLARMSRG